MISNDADPDIHATPHVKSQFGSTVATVSALQDHRGQRSVGQGRDERGSTHEPSMMASPRGLGWRSAEIAKANYRFPGFNAM